MLREIGMSIIIFFGLPLGVALGGICRDEVIAGKRWLLLLKRALYLLLVGVTLFYHRVPWQIATILIVGGVGYLLLNYRGVYAVLGLAFGILAAEQNPGLIHATTIMFLFGLPAGSLMASMRKDSKLPQMLLSAAKYVGGMFFPFAFLPLLVAYL